MRRKERLALGPEGRRRVETPNPTAQRPARGMSDFAFSDVPVMRSSGLVVAIH
ncbi:MAG: hypothetical protein JRF70_13010 [Deltaproteobacteria bacterium]|nr:hypothetical protein [Deltaproteobacteria bacterium]